MIRLIGVLFPLDVFEKVFYVTTLMGFVINAIITMGEKATCVKNYSIVVLTFLCTLKSYKNTLSFSKYQDKFNQKGLLFFDQAKKT